MNKDILEKAKKILRKEQEEDKIRIQQEVDLETCLHAFICPECGGQLKIEVGDFADFCSFFKYLCKNCDFWLCKC